MMKKSALQTAMFASVLISAAAWSSGSATAEPAYDAEAIIQHFADNVDLGETRGLCIGTVSECDQQSRTAEAEAPFNLLLTFPLGSSALTPEAQANLDEFANALNDLRLSKFNFYVDGHTDQRGGDAFNLELSRQRANAVVGYRMRHGIPMDRLTPRGFGEKRLAVEDGYADVNRRVETSLSHVME